MAAEVNRGLVGNGRTREVVTGWEERVTCGDRWSSDVFLSHSSSQKSVAREMNEELSKRGFKVFIYEDYVPFFMLSQMPSTSEIVCSSYCERIRKLEISPVHTKAKSQLIHNQGRPSPLLPLSQ